MKNLAKFIMVSLFALGAMSVFLSSKGSLIGAAVPSQVSAQPTPPVSNASANANAAATAQAAMTPNTNSNAAPKATDSPAAYVNSINKTCCPLDEAEVKGLVEFSHDAHAFNKSYSEEGKSAPRCAECHHTDQPKSDLKPPLVTSQRCELLTFNVWKNSTWKEVRNCKECHFRLSDVPRGKAIPTLKIIENGKEKEKVYDNELAYHVNCTNCHAQAAEKRPELKEKKRFATKVSQCAACHKESS